MICKPGRQDRRDSIKPSQNERASLLRVGWWRKSALKILFPLFFIGPPFFLCLATLFRCHLFPTVPPFMAFFSAHIMLSYIRLVHRLFQTPSSFAPGPWWSPFFEVPEKGARGSKPRK